MTTAIKQVKPQILLIWTDKCYVLCGKVSAYYKFKFIYNIYNEEKIYKYTKYLVEMFIERDVIRYRQLK